MEKDQETKPASLLCYHQDQKQHQNKYYVVLDDAVVPVKFRHFSLPGYRGSYCESGEFLMTEALDKIFSKKAFLMLFT